MKDKTKGCAKCDYTGFAYAKIPCECTKGQVLVKGGQEIVEDETRIYYNWGGKGVSLDRIKETKTILNPSPESYPATSGVWNW